MFSKDVSATHQTCRAWQQGFLSQPNSVERDSRGAMMTPLHRSLAGLTDRERQTLKLIADGQSTKRIAFTLGVSTKTVETHRKRLMDKLQLDSVVGLAKHAIRVGLIAL